MRAERLGCDCKQVRGMLVYIAPPYWETNGASQTNRQSVARCLTKLKQVIAPRPARRYAPRRWQFDSRRIYVRPRTGPQSAHLRSDSLDSCATQPACLYPRLDRQTDRQTDKRIAVLLNAPPPKTGDIISLLNITHLETRQSATPASTAFKDSSVRTTASAP